MTAIPPAPNEKPSGVSLDMLRETAAWAWTAIAAGGGLWLLFTEGLWPLTNGWFALCSGIAACPLTPWLLRTYAGVPVSGWLRFCIAAAFFIAGKIAVAIS